jgi:hypothetical protein
MVPPFFTIATLGPTVSAYGLLEDTFKSYPNHSRKLAKEKRTTKAICPTRWQNHTHSNDRVLEKGNHN